MTLFLALVLMGGLLPSFEFAFRDDTTVWFCILSLVFSAFGEQSCVLAVGRTAGKRGAFFGVGPAWTLVSLPPLPFSSSFSSAFSSSACPIFPFNGVFMFTGDGFSSLFLEALPYRFLVEAASVEGCTPTWKSQRRLGLRRNTRSMIELLQFWPFDFDRRSSFRVAVAFLGDPRGFTLNQGAGVFAVFQPLV